eukprot:9496288-Pyramimonas_sp.AAC.1
MYIVSRRTPLQKPEDETKTKDCYYQAMCDDGVDRSFLRLAQMQPEPVLFEHCLLSGGLGDTIWTAPLRRSSSKQRRQ